MLIDVLNDIPITYFLLSIYCSLHHYNSQFAAQRLPPISPYNWYSVQSLFDLSHFSLYNLTCKQAEIIFKLAIKCYVPIRRQYFLI